MLTLLGLARRLFALTALLRLTLLALALRSALRLTRARDFAWSTSTRRISRDANRNRGAHLVGLDLLGQIAAEVGWQAPARCCRAGSSRHSLRRRRRNRGATRAARPREKLVEPNRDVMVVSFCWIEDDRHKRRGEQPGQLKWNFGDTRDVVCHL